jgi:SAM-dependent methyltransferase
MDWIHDFYRRQDALTGCYQLSVSDSDRRRADLVQQRLPAHPAAVLELGCGGGQTASAIADRGNRVVAVDLNPSALEHAGNLAALRDDNLLTAVLGDFYALDYRAEFDLVCYFDGFGIGEDDDQQRLLTLISDWLRPGGGALIEVYTPWYWSKVAGREMQFGNAKRRYGYNADGQRMLDTWWPDGNTDSAITQSLRCYSPDELRELASGTALRLIDIKPGGAVDYERNAFLPNVPLDQAMNYLAWLTR